MEHSGEKRLEIYLSTTHGVKHIFNRESSVVRRALWGLLYIGLLFGCLYNVSKAIEMFARIPVATTVYTDNVDKLTFPAVTVCNLNGFNNSYLKKKDLSEIVSEALFEKLRPEHTQCATNVPPTYPFNSTLFDTAIEASQPRESLIKGCNFLGKPCNMSEMFIDYHTSFGNCFTFNGKNPERNYSQVPRSGFRHDLELILNIEQDTFIGSADHEVGALVSIHEQDDPALISESGFHIPVGHSAYLAVAREHTEDRTDHPGGDELKCIHVSEAPELKLSNNNYTYSTRVCLIECIIKNINQTCHCLWPNNEANKEYRTCNISDLCCLYSALRNPSNCTCPNLCNYTSYKVVPSYATFPSNEAAERILAQMYNVSEQTLRANFLKVHVFFESLSIRREITERSSSPTQLVAYIGGNMGIFLGANIITIVEFLVLIFDQIKSRFFSHPKEKKKKFICCVKLYEPNQNMKDKTDQLIASSVFDTDYEDFDDLVKNE